MDLAYKPIAKVVLKIATSAALKFAKRVNIHSQRFQLFAAAQFRQINDESTAN